MWSGPSLDALQDQALADRRQADLAKFRQAHRKTGRKSGQKAGEKAGEKAGRRLVDVLNTPPVPRIEHEPLLASLDVFASAIVLTQYGRYGEEGDRPGKVIRTLVEPAEAAGLFTTKAEKEGRWLAIEEGIVAAQPIGERRWRLLVSRPAGRAVIRLQSGARVRPLKVRLPALLAEIDVQAEPGGRRSYLAIGRVFSHYAPRGRGGRPETGTMLHACPLPNCYAGGSWCHGDVQVNRAAFADMSAVQVLEATFVRDCIHTGHASTDPLSDRGVRAYRGVVDLLALGKTPPAWATRTVMTFAQLMGGKK